MLNLEQVKLLDTRVARTVDYVERLTGENAALRKKLHDTQKRIDELEVLVSRFKEEQEHIEDGILSALDRLSKFESAIERSLASRGKEAKPAAPAREKSVKDTPTKKPETVNQAESPVAEPLNSIEPDIEDPLETEDTDALEDSTKSESNKGGELDIF